MAGECVMGSRGSSVVGLVVGLWGVWGCGPPEPAQVIGSGSQPIINGSPCLSVEAPTAVALIWEATIKTQSIEVPIGTGSTSR